MDERLLRSASAAAAFVFRATDREEMEDFAGNRLQSALQSCMI